MLTDRVERVDEALDIGRDPVEIACLDQKIPVRESRRLTSGSRAAITRTAEMAGWRESAAVTTTARVRQKSPSWTAGSAVTSGSSSGGGSGGVSTLPISSGKRRKSCSSTLSIAGV